VPGARIEETSVEEFEAEAARVRPRVVFCAVRDAAAGLAALKQLRSSGAGPRILFLTPAAAIGERLAALEAGFDDVLTSPVDDAELAGRLALLLRRPPATRVTRLPVGDGLELDIDRRELLRDGKWVHLRPKEAGLLELLARMPGRPLTRDHILRRVWGADHLGDRRTVDVHVRWLRAKIEPDPRRPVRLLTVRGVGYRLEPPAPRE
jgi:DNA-binding response OmpR family regulator